MDIELNGIICTIINLYAPTKNYEQEQIKTLNLIHEVTQKYNMENIIWGGDFNLYMDPKLDKIGVVNETESSDYREELTTILDIENLVDIWRHQNKEKIRFTWQRGQQKSRLDYIFISEHLLNREIKTDITPMLLTDHCLLTTEIDTHIIHRAGKGFWKFNSSLLNDPTYVKEIKKIIHETGAEYSYLDDKNTLWELIKLSIRNFSIPYSIKKKKAQIQETENLKKRMNELFEIIQDISRSDIEELTTEYNSIKQELESIDRHQAMGAIVRAKCLWTEEGERNTSYFLRLEKRNYSNKVISQLQINDEIITEPQNILKAEKEFYQNLYTESGYCEEKFTIKADYFAKLNNEEKLTEVDKEWCEIDISEQEVLNSLKCLKNGKTPGTDGLGPNSINFSG